MRVKETLTAENPEDNLPLVLGKSIMNSMEQGHSANFMNAYRDHWWNTGFLNDMAGRLNLGQKSSLLDVGCGQCHWSKVLLPYLADHPVIRAVDNDEHWIAQREALAAYFTAGEADFFMQQADASQLPFDNNSFDLVTCQTLLIHVEYPEEVITEMKRVLKPNGVILCAEPNNRVQQLIRTSLTKETSIDEVLDHVRYALLYEEGKKVLGQGDNSIGDLLPGLIVEAGFEDIEVRLSDKAIAMYPPYGRKDQVATLQQWAAGDHISATGTDERDYFQTMGPESLAFYEAYHAKYMNQLDELLNALEEKAYHSGGGALMYVVSAKKCT